MEREREELEGPARRDQVIRETSSLVGDSRLARGVRLRREDQVGAAADATSVARVKAILMAAGIGLALNKQSRMAAASIGALMTVLTLFLYLLILILAHGGSATEINEALNFLTKND